MLSFTTISPVPRRRLTLTERRGDALRFAPGAAIVVADEIEQAGFGAVAQEDALCGTRVLKVGRCYVTAWH